MEENDWTGPRERHRDAGAYALGVLGAADRFRYEDHLGRCAVCAAYVAELGSMARLLELYALATPPCVELFPRPVPLGGVMERLAAARAGARRRVRWAGAVAGLVLLAGGLGVVLPGGSGAGDPGAVTLRGRDARTGVAATVTADARAWGTAVDLDVRDGGGPRVCALVAVGRDGSEETVASWAVRRERTRVSGGAALSPGRIARFEVRAADGARLLTVPAGSG
ncbi:hypothetical protein ACFW9D_10940 [Streptomyces sp. NPDC059524]|uniref:hypothetical protein n=1 Tax=Streptomyces sp. NPDC059524 TaxID=3346856 RepID=UPI0036B1AE9B